MVAVQHTFTRSGRVYTECFLRDMRLFEKGGAVFVTAVEAVEAGKCGCFGRMHLPEVTSGLWFRWLLWFGFGTRCE